MHIRLFQPGDHASALALWRQTAGVGLSSADEADAIHAYLRRNPGTSFVAERHGRLLGTVLCGHDGRRGLIHHLVTATDCRRQGIGRTLVARALAALRVQGIGKCHLMVFGDNAEGRAFWRGIGAEERSALVLYSLPTDS